jgi:predicted kinase
MKENKHVVIDNTNPKAVDRKAYIDLAKKLAYPVRAFYLEVTKDLAMHNDQ